MNSDRVDMSNEESRNDFVREKKPQVWTDPVHFLAFGFGSGLAPKAPGTFGTLAAIPVYIGLAFLPLWLNGLIILAAFFVGIYICGKTSSDLGVHDHSGIVFDEFVGLWIALFGFTLNSITVIAGFLIFRFFDIVKPWPINLLDKNIHGGLGIMIDDVIAGLYTWLVIALGINILN